MSIKILNVSNNNLGPRGINLLAKIDMKTVTSANLSNCCLGDNGALHLIKCDWPALEDLDLGYNTIGLDGWMELVRGKWKSLAKFSACNSLISVVYNVMSPIALVHLTRLDTKKVAELTLCLWGVKNQTLEKEVN